MPLHDVSQASARGPGAPTCRNCLQAATVRTVALHDLSPGVEYWRCDGCGFVWATQDGNDLTVAVQSRAEENR
jgi:hypothetical protein